MSKKEKHKKKKRQQPRPKIKKSLKKLQQPRKGSNSYITRIRNISKKILETFKDKERVKSIISENISIIEEYFRKYDRPVRLKIPSSNHAVADFLLCDPFSKFPVSHCCCNYGKCTTPFS